MKKINISILKLITLLFLPFIIIRCNTTTDKTDNTITIKGSDSELNLLRFFSEEYQKQNKTVKFDISGGGTSKGIEAFIKGGADIANVSRLMTYEEISEAYSKGLDPVSYIIASDVVAIITHHQVGLDSISLSQLSKIMHGDIQNWKEVGGLDLPIKIYGRDDNSGTKYYLLQRLGFSNFSSLHVNFNNNKDVIEAVAKEKGAIGYVNLGSIVNKDGKPISNIWAMNLYTEGIPSCSPYEKERIKNSEYLLTRPLIQYINKNSDEKIVDFIRFEIEEEQQQHLERHGFFHISEIQVNMNTKNGLFN